MEKDARAYRMENGSAAAGFGILPSSHPGRRCAPPARDGDGGLSLWRGGEQLEARAGKGEDGGGEKEKQKASPEGAVRGAEVLWVPARGGLDVRVHRVACFQLLLCLVKRACSSLVGLAATATARRVRCALWCRGGPWAGPGAQAALPSGYPASALQDFKVFQDCHRIK
jgi:hypothetical protein